MILVAAACSRGRHRLLVLLFAAAACAIPSFMVLTRLEYHDDSYVLDDPDDPGNEFDYR